MDRVEYHTKLITKIAQIGFCLLLAALGVWLRHDHPNPVDLVFGTLTIITGTSVCIRLLFRLRDRSPRIILDDIGIYDRQLGTPLIPWNDIAAAKVVIFFGSGFIGLLPIDQAERVRAFSPIRRIGVFTNRIFGLPPFCLNPNGLNAPAKEVHREIWKRLANAGHNQQQPNRAAKARSIPRLGRSRR